MIDVNKIVKGEYYKVDNNSKKGRFVKALEDGQTGKWPLVEWVIDETKQRLPLTFIIRKATTKEKDRDILAETI
jgi:hypothetical protein